MSDTPQVVIIGASDLEALVKRAVAEVLSQQAQPAAEVPAMLDLDAAAALVSLHPWQLRDAARRDELPAYRPVGTRLRFIKDEVLAWATRPREKGKARRRAK